MGKTECCRVDTEPRYIADIIADVIADLKVKAATQTAADNDSDYKRATRKEN